MLSVATFAEVLVLAAVAGAGSVDVAVFKILHILLGGEDGLYTLEVFGTLVLEIAHLLVAVGFANGIVGEFLLAGCLAKLIDFLLLLFGEVEAFERIESSAAGLVAGFNIAAGSLGAYGFSRRVLSIHAESGGGDNGESYKNFLHFCN